MSTPTKAAPVAAITSKQVLGFLVKCLCPYSKQVLEKIYIVPESVPLLLNFSVLSITKKQMGEEFYIVAGVVKDDQDDTNLQVFTVCIVNFRTFVNIRPFELLWGDSLSQLRIADSVANGCVNIEFVLETIHSIEYSQRMSMQFCYSTMNTSL